MPSTFFGLDIGKTGLYAYQASLNTTAHNISNADTKGYSRQVASQSANKALSLNSQYGMAGTGVEITGIEQERNEYYDMKYWANNNLYGEYASKEYYMLAVENYFSEVNADGTTASFDKFYSTLSNLATDVSNTTIRTEVTSYAESFATYINYLSKSLGSLQEESNRDIKNTVDQINSIAEQVASLNKQINTLEIKGGTANDLRDARALLIDEMSELANITVSENKVGTGQGVNQYIVRVNGKVLVDTYEFNQLVCVPSETKNNQNDVDGLYDLQWSNGQDFDTSSKTLGGKLQALFEFRDGNNLESFTGTAAGEMNTKTITIKSANINDINKLNIPASDGIITIGNKEYEYDSFTGTLVTENPDIFEYEFTLKEALETTVNPGMATIGKRVDYKGVPYYMAQLNEFCRTFSTAFNRIHNQAEDLSGEKGLDFFNGTNAVSGENFTLTEDFELGKTFSSMTKKDADGKTYGSYYNMTVANFVVTKEVAEDPKKVACAGKINNGVEDTTYLDQMIELKSDVTMFKQGKPDSFLQTLTAEMGIDSQKAQTFARSQNNILKAIDTQRMSISGVDTDEEAMNLVKFQNAYNLSAKVISVMDEIFDKLINGMAV